jgi:plasmid stability protein
MGALFFGAVIAMADVKVRKLEDWVITTLQHQAKRRGHSLEEELRCVLTDTALKAQHEFAASAKAIRQRIFETHANVFR